MNNVYDLEEYRMRRNFIKWIEAIIEEGGNPHLRSLELYHKYKNQDLDR